MCTVDQVTHASNQRIQVYSAWPQRLPLRIGQQALDERHCLGRSVHRRSDSPKCSTRGRVKVPLQYLEISDDHRQKVIEVVRNAAGELANCFRLLELM